MDFMTYFQVPDVANSMVDLIVSKEEKQLIERIKNEKYPLDELARIIEEDFHVIDGKERVKEMYKRAVLNKIELDDDVYYKTAGFYDRIAYFCQYETKTWFTVSQEIRDQIDAWYVNAYAQSASIRLQEMIDGERDLIENAFFYTLQESLQLIDSIEKTIYVVPCNCRSVAQNCRKPKGVCLLFEHGVNSQWDRGYGKALSKEEAKSLVIEADKKGLMHTSETDHALCNCCGCCCYPIRASKAIGTTGVWPKKRYDILWDEKKCIHCGKCTRTCNFEAFVKEKGKVQFVEEKCLGCTLCQSHCPVNAITLQKIEDAM